jgi:hypothetical protein
MYDHLSFISLGKGGKHWKRVLPRWKILPQWKKWKIWNLNGRYLNVKNKFQDDGDDDLTLWAG